MNKKVFLDPVEEEHAILSQDVHQLLFFSRELHQMFLLHPRLAMKQFHYITNLYEMAHRSHEINWEVTLNEEQDCPFTFVIQQGNYLFALHLSLFGVDVDHARVDGTTALLLVSKKGSLEMVQWLVELGANVNVQGGVSSSFIPFD